MSPEKSHNFHKNIKPHKCLQYWLNVSWAENLNIILISEGSCDTEDWSTDAENSALHHRNKLYFKIHSNRKLFFINFINISQF